MKTFPVALQATYDSDTPTIASALRITRRDATVYAFTTLDESQTIDGLLYVAQGLADSSFESAADLSVGNLTLTTLDDGTIFTLRDIVGGLWQGAQYTAFRYDWTDPTKGKEHLSAGELGEIGFRRHLRLSLGTVTDRAECPAPCRDAGVRTAFGKGRVG